MERKGLTGVFLELARSFPLCCPAFFTASLGFMVSAGEKNSRFKIITETWNKEIRDQDGRTPCQRSIGNVWGTLSSWPGNNLIQAERPSSEKLDFGRRSLDWLKE